MKYSANLFRWGPGIFLSILIVIGGLTSSVQAQSPGVCDGVTCDNLQESICDAGGFRVSLTDYIPAPSSGSGAATYTYEICSPPEGVCSGGTGLRAGESCSDNSFCQSKGQDTDPGALCDRECAVDDFRKPESL